MPRNWKLQDNVNIAGGKKQIMSLEPAKNNKYYKLDDLRKLGQAEAKIIQKLDPTAKLGIAYHYKSSNVWISANMNEVVDEFQLTDVSNSGGQAYDDDDIDSICFIAVKGDTINKKLTPKRKGDVDINIFKK